MRCLQGQLLVATHRQHDPNFSQTVILVIEHDDRGAFGVVISRPTNRVPDFFWRRVYRPQCSVDLQLNLGGPVIGPLMTVHTNRLLGETEISPGLFFSAREENVAGVVRQSTYRYRTFVGYAGWAAQQLEEEIERGMWEITPAAAELVFSTSEDLWKDLFRQISESMLRIVLHVRHIPQDPLMN